LSSHQSSPVTGISSVTPEHCHLTSYHQTPSSLQSPQEIFILPITTRTVLPSAIIRHSHPTSHHCTMFSHESPAVTVTPQVTHHSQSSHQSPPDTGFQPVTIRHCHSTSHHQNFHPISHQQTS
jgi:hypothetical protein